MIRSCTEVLSLLYRIPYGILGNDEWNKESMTIVNEYGESFEYPMLYRDITACLKFLIGHVPFATEMVWAPNTTIPW